MRQLATEKHDATGEAWAETHGGNNDASPFAKVIDNHHDLLWIANYMEKMDDIIVIDDESY